MYSCGSLAPKMGRGGGCSDCKFRRPPQPWELCDGCVYLINELSSIPEACTPVDSILPSLAKSLQHKHYTSHLVLYETVCKVLPNIAKGIGKKLFKSRLHLFLDPLFYSLVSSSFIFVLYWFLIISKPSSGAECAICTHIFYRAIANNLTNLKAKLVGIKL